jgi:hypothetical protein
MLTEIDAILDEFINRIFRKKYALRANIKGRKSCLDSISRAKPYQCAKYIRWKAWAAAARLLFFEIKVYIDSPSLMQLRIQFFSPEGMLFGYLI